MKITAILLNYKSGTLLEKNIKGLLSEADNNLAIIVVNNGEYDKNGQKIALSDFLDAELVKKVKIIENKTNVGFGAACNQGISVADDGIILLLNPDCFVEKEDIKKLASKLTRYPQIGIVGPRIVDENNKDLKWSYSRQLNIWDKLFLCKKDKKVLLNQDIFLEPANSEEGESRGVVWLSGACLAFDKAFFQEIGGFDERFFMYFEDKDLCLRAIYKGKKVVRCTEAAAVHLESKSDVSWSLRKKLYYKSQTYFFRKHYGRIAALVLMLLRLPYYVRNVYFSS